MIVSLEHPLNGHSGGMQRRMKQQGEEVDQEIRLGNPMGSGMSWNKHELGVWEYGFRVSKWPQCVNRYIH